jgi:hypothetical protein
MRSQSAEFKKLMSFQFLRKADVVEVIKAVDRVTKRFIVLFLDEQVIVCIVDSFNIKLM